jgi:hypothetical protein
MGRLCTICTHPERQAIDAALLVREAGYEKIAKRFDVSWQALYGHTRKHLREQIRQYKELAMLASSESLIAEMNRLHAYVSRVLERGEAAGDDRLVLLGVSQGQRNVETLARIGPLGDIQREIDALKASLQQGQGDSHADE